MASKDGSPAGKSNGEEITCSRDLCASGKVECDFKSNYVCNEKNIQTQYVDGSDISDIDMSCKTQTLKSNKEGGGSSGHRINVTKLKHASVLKNKTSCIMKKNQSKFRDEYLQTPKKELCQTIIKNFKVSPKIKKRPNKYFGSKSLHSFSNQVGYTNYFKCVKYNTVNEDIVKRTTYFNKKNANLRQPDHYERLHSGMDIHKNNEEKLVNECTNMDNAEEYSDEEIMLSQQIKPVNNYLSDFCDSYNLFLKEVLFDYFHAVNFSDVEDFLTCEEQSYVNSVIHIKLSAQRLYARLLARKHKWIRISSMKYDKVSKNLNEDLTVLKDAGLITAGKVVCVCVVII